MDFARPSPALPPAAPAGAPRPRGAAPRAPSPYGRLFRDGHPWVWVTRCTTALLLLMVAGIVALVVVRGLSTFWPRRIHRFELADGSVLFGEEVRRETRRVGAEGRIEEEVQVRLGNRDLHGGGQDFRWVRAADIRAASAPEDLLSFERMENGPAYGRVRRVVDVVREGGRSVRRTVAEGDGALEVLRARMADAEGRREERLRIQKGEMARLRERQAERDRREARLLATVAPEDPSFAPRQAALEAQRAELEREYEALSARLAPLQAEDRRHLVEIEDGGGTPVPKARLVSEILRVDEVNRLGLPQRVGLFAARFWRFLTENPREANSEGGIWPALFGTMLMTLLMTLFVVPFGVVAAVYLREYARQGAMISAVRIAVNNLAGVPSVVFGVFGLGFFCYLVGGWIDRTWFADLLPSPTFGGGGILWASLTLALLTVPVVIVATEEALASVPKSLREASVGCGASKWQTLWRVVLPHASPGILTGAILAMARGAGEVAPLMLTGVVKSTASLPLDGEFPFLHPERRFMHLGFHVYDTGFQSPNVDASTPLVYSTTLVLLGLVLLLNLGAILLRNRLRRRFRTGVF